MAAGGRNKVLQSAYHCPITCLGHWDYCEIPFPLNDPTTYQVPYDTSSIPPPSMSVLGKNIKLLEHLKVDNHLNNV